jgi:hypothetical protein
MSNKDTILDYYNSEIIKKQTLLIQNSIINFPFFLIRSGWDVQFIHIDQPCLLRTSRREHNDFGVLIPDSSTQSLDVLYNYKKQFENINYKNKQNSLIWRGVYSGIVTEKNNDILQYNDVKFKHYSRYNFINTFYNKYDTKFTITNYPGMISREELILHSEQRSNYILPEIMATNYKYQIALNGNSFAGSFGWNLLSNSVVFHPKYEDNFHTYIFPRENIDYISIKDNYEDLDEKISYFNYNEDKAEIIALNGKKYIEKLINFSELLTKKTMENIYLLYNQETLLDAVQFMDKHLTKINVMLDNYQNFIIYTN